MSTSETPAQLLAALAGLRANKAALYLLAGALGGAVGAVLAEFTPAGQKQASALYLTLKMDSLSQLQTMEHRIPRLLAR